MHFKPRVCVAHEYFAQVRWDQRIHFQRHEMRLDFKIRVICMSLWRGCILQDAQSGSARRMRILAECIFISSSSVIRFAPALVNNTENRHSTFFTVEKASFLYFA